ncbi:MAG: SnoaL-like domain-containing protein [Streptomycetaceae bacterium]|nr:SnoaL-like domain-containing protein [Streptomycetaceae bacterium]
MTDTRTTVEEFFRRTAAGDMDQAGALFADRVDWDIYGADEVPWTGRRTTGAEAAAFFRELPGHLTPEEFTVDRILVDGEHAVAMGRMKQRVRHSGGLFDSPFAFHLTVEDGRITRYIPYEDSLALARAFGVV